MKFSEPTPNRFIDRVDQSPQRLDRGSRLLKVCPEAAELGFEIGDPIFDRRLGCTVCTNSAVSQPRSAVVCSMVFVFVGASTARLPRSLMMKARVRR